MRDATLVEPWEPDLDPIEPRRMPPPPGPVPEWQPDEHPVRPPASPDPEPEPDPV
jgi:hypothetical protein